MEDFSDAVARIKDKQAESARLMAELERSYALAGLWPEVFDHGRATVQHVTRHEPRKTAPGVRENVPCLVRIEVRNGAGELRTFPADAVPELLRGGFPT